jgi:N-glycosylase/DNA lyase
MWQTLADLAEAELHLRHTLLNGQCFNWKQVGPDEFTGVLFGALVSLARKDARVLFRVVPARTDFKELLWDYFNLNTSIIELYRTWALHKDFKTAAERYPGMRCLRQPPFECLLGFICSQNNNIARIRKLV